MPCPPLPGWFIEFQPVQASACKGLEVIHDSLWLRFGVDDDVDVVGADMGGAKVPAAIRAAFYDGPKHGLPAAMIHVIRWLVHLAPLRQNSRPIRIKETAAI